MSPSKSNGPSIIRRTTSKRNSINVMEDDKENITINTSLSTRPKRGLKQVADKENGIERPAKRRNTANSIAVLANSTNIRSTNENTLQKSEKILVQGAYASILFEDIPLKPRRSRRLSSASSTAVALQPTQPEIQPVDDPMSLETTESLQVSPDMDCLVSDMGSEMLDYLAPQEVIRIRRLSLRWRNFVDERPDIKEEAMKLEILHNLKKREVRDVGILESAVSSVNLFMGVQQRVVPRYRTILIDWLSEVNDEFKLKTEVLFLAVRYIDMFLSQHMVSRSHLQNLGVTCMLLSSKMEEVSPPLVDDFVFITAQTYTAVQIREMEQLALRVLDWQLNTPHLLTYMSWFLELARSEERTAQLAQFFARMSLLDHAFSGIAPSKLVCACIALAGITRQIDNPWSSRAEAYIGYSLEDLVPSIIKLWELHRDAPARPQQSIRRKFVEDQFQSGNILALDRVTLLAALSKNQVRHELVSCLFDPMGSEVDEETGSSEGSVADESSRSSV
eukprot:GILJ01003590.1.p1 GENE.GILJ01003590.1~~GILJ01003590.1.p1  ORF type:complete len:505 (-),score=83.55 GILJ01003590.1:547-2061(-)